MIKFQSNTTIQISHDDLCAIVQETICQTYSPFGGAVVTSIEQEPTEGSFRFVVFPTAESEDA